MKIPETVKGGFHLAMLALAIICGTYNLTKKKPKNKFLVCFYSVVAGVEVTCVIDHAKEVDDG